MSWILWGILIGLSVILLTLAIIYIVNHVSNKKYKEWWSQSEFNVFEIIDKDFSYNLFGDKILYLVLFQPFTGKIYRRAVTTEFYYGDEEGDTVSLTYNSTISLEDGSRDYYSECVNKKFKWFRSKVLYYISIGLTTLLPFVLAVAIPLQLLYMPGPKCEECGHYSTVLHRDDEYTCTRNSKCDYHDITIYTCKDLEGKHITYSCNHCNNTWHVVKQKDKQKRDTVLVQYANAFQVEDEFGNTTTATTNMMGDSFFLNGEFVRLRSWRVVEKDSEWNLSLVVYETGKTTYYTIIKYSVDNGKTWTRLK